MANLITMAGRGTRFSNQGYVLPKALIEVSGKPMIHKVIETLPESDKWIFIVRQEHIMDYQIDKIIKEVIPNAIVVVDTELTGQASLGAAREHLDDDEEVLIAGCDCGVLYDKDKFEDLKNSDYDCIMWTFTQDNRITDKPTSWGYTVLDTDGTTIKDMSVKVPPSPNPYNDHVVTAIFYLSSAKLLFDAVQNMIDKDIKTNNEYYLDNLPVALKNLNKKSTILDVNLYVGWGTPEELHQYELLQYLYKFSDLKKSGIDNNEIKLWKEYFQTFEQG